jgi:hypothetical protein
MAKRKKFIPSFIVMNQKWVKGFMISHIAGWTMACLQTVWIVYEVRKYCRK